MTNIKTVDAQTSLFEDLKDEDLMALVGGGGSLANVGPFDVGGVANGGGIANNLAKNAEIANDLAKNGGILNGTTVAVAA